MGMRAEAHLVYGVVLNYDDTDYEILEELVYTNSSNKFEYMFCGHPDASERFVLYDRKWHYSVEWDETYLLQPGDMEAAVDVIALCAMARAAGCKNPEPGWHLVAYYG